VEYGGAMLNRALFALESAWHVHFKAAMLASTAWLPHDDGVNRLMFAALQRRVRGLARQGVHRTALEWAKLTLGLDTDDPCGMLFHIDYFCLRARECAPFFSVMTLTATSFWLSAPCCHVWCKTLFPTPHVSHGSVISASLQAHASPA
jgi:hypothetical protein